MVGGRGGESERSPRPHTVSHLISITLTAFGVCVLPAVLYAVCLREHFYQDFSSNEARTVTIMTDGVSKLFVNKIKVKEKIIRPLYLWLFWLMLILEQF